MSFEDQLDRIERKLDALIAGLVVKEQEDAERIAAEPEVKCRFCRGAGRSISNCPACGGSGG